MPNNTVPIHLKEGENYSGYNFISPGANWGPGTLEQWNELTLEQKNQYKTADIIDDFNGVPIDDALSSTSEHPVQNKIVTAALEGVNDFIDDQVNILGAKNLIPYPYYSGASYINNGITFMDTNGIITANGTATGTAGYHVSTRVVGLGTVLKAGTRYKLTGCPIGGSDSTYYMYINGYILGTETGIEAKTDYGEGVEFSFDDDVIAGVWIKILEGVTANNLTFKPMLRPASVKDDIWTPYAMTNKELTKSVLPLIQNSTLQTVDLPVSSECELSTKWNSSCIIKRNNICQLVVSICITIPTTDQSYLLFDLPENCKPVSVSANIASDWTYYAIGNRSATQLNRRTDYKYQIKIYNGKIYVASDVVLSTLSSNYFVSWNITYITD